MAASAIWTALTDAVSNTKLTAARWNTEVRDNLTYIKGVLSGLDLQNVTVHANRVLQWGTLRVLVHPFANKQHIEHGYINVPSNSQGTVTFTRPFADVPSAVVVCTDGGTALPTYTVSTTQIIIQAGSETGGGMRWIAMGQTS
jgi:hypothetical protein